MNIPVLVTVLQEVSSSDDFYFGRWPEDVIVNKKLMNGILVRSRIDGGYIETAIWLESIYTEVNFCYHKTLQAGHVCIWC